jgi:hypothetical protein
MPFYAEYSHLSVFAAASTRIFASAGLRQLGGEFDAKKKTAYQREIRLAVSEAKRLYQTIEVAEHHLINSEPLNNT